MDLPSADMSYFTTSLRTSELFALIRELTQRGFICDINNLGWCCTVHTTKYGAVRIMQAEHVGTSQDRSYCVYAVKLHVAFFG